MARSSSPTLSPSAKATVKVVRASKAKAASSAPKSKQRLPPDRRERRSRSASSSESVSGLALLRGLVAENLVLRREVAELRLLTAGACHDPMTGLGNRTFLRQRLAEEISRSQRRSEHAGVLVLVRITDLRALARGADRRACLEAIQALAQSFRTALRVADLCCRVAFGTFGFLLPDTEPAGAARVVRRLRAAAMRVSAKASVPLSVSFGMGSWPLDGMTVTKIWNGAEDALSREERHRRRVPPQSATTAPLKTLKVLRGGLAG